MAGDQQKEEYLGITVCTSTSKLVPLRVAVTVALTVTRRWPAGRGQGMRLGMRLGIELTNVGARKCRYSEGRRY